ncbi:hypothetical protein AFLA_005600 [Aspergillus flavus NRRL3357]|nr:hypothetical protein AFLA_005600 [Aspergillus flavus NRRL3357]
MPSSHTYSHRAKQLHAQHLATTATQKHISGRFFLHCLHQLRPNLSHPDPNRPYISCSLRNSKIALGFAQQL